MTDNSIRLHTLWFAAGALLCAGAFSAAPTHARSEQHLCRPDDKLIGIVRLSTDDLRDSWWTLTREGLDASGINTPEGYLAAINVFYSAAFTTLDAAKQYLVEQVVPFDVNGDGLVCAYSLRGTRTSFGDPYYRNYVFSVQDNLLPKK